MVEGPAAGAAQPEPPGVADARKAPGGDDEFAWRACDAVGFFRTWEGKTQAERESLERMHLSSKNGRWMTKEGKDKTGAWRSRWRRD